MSRHVKPSEVFARYYPLDHVLELPRVRVLRALRHFDEASAGDLRLALDIPDDDRARNALARTLMRLAADRHIARHGDRCSFLYRITALGRKQLAGILARGTVSDVEARP